MRAGQIADLAVHKGYAYLNSWDDPDCRGGGTYVVDIRNPAQPQQVGFIPAPANYYHGEGAHVVSIDTPQFRGDILAVNDETYGSNLTLNPVCAPAGQVGRRLRPLRRDGSRPTRRRSYRAPVTPTRTTTRPTPERAFGNSYHSVFVWQDGPRAYLVASDNTEFTDVDIFDITDPTAPVQVGDHDLSSCSPRSWMARRPTAAPSSTTTSWSSSIGGRPVMKADYWDAGYVQMDVSDPANPVLINDTTFAARIRCFPAAG